jgi:hypothetical protein
MYNIFHKIFRLEQHEILKPLILKSINDFEPGSIHNKDDLISKTDWVISPDVERKYFDYLKPFIDTVYFDYVKTMGADRLHVGNFWFQQYTEHGTHGLHCHPGAHFSNIYYLELPEGTPQTEFINPYNSEVFNFDVREGDVLMFPAYYPHRSPLIVGDKRKTVIVFNSSMEIL